MKYNLLCRGNSSYAVLFQRINVLLLLVRLHTCSASLMPINNFSIFLFRLFQFVSALPDVTLEPARSYLAHDPPVDAVVPVGSLYLRLNSCVQKGHYFFVSPSQCAAIFNTLVTQLHVGQTHLANRVVNLDFNPD